MCLYFFFFFFKQKTAYEMRISDWSSDVCSSDLSIARRLDQIGIVEPVAVARIEFDIGAEPLQRTGRLVIRDARVDRLRLHARNLLAAAIENLTVGAAADALVIAPIDLIVVAVGHRQLRTRQVLRQRLPAEPDFDSAMLGTWRVERVALLVDAGSLRDQFVTEQLVEAGHVDAQAWRSEGRRVGKERVRQCRSRGWQ